MMVYDGVARGVYRRSIYLFLHLFTVYSLQFTIYGCVYYRYRTTQHTAHSDDALATIRMVYDSRYEECGEVMYYSTGTRAYKKIITCVVFNLFTL